MIKVKEGVNLYGLNPQMILAIIVAKEVYDKYEVDMVVTSGTDGVHGRSSRHYVGNALDIRTRDFKSVEDATLAKGTISSNLGEQYDVLLESNHIHIEFDPK